MVHGILFTGFLDIARELVNRFQDGNVIIDELVFSGTHDGPWIGVPATGKPVTVPATIVYEFADGALVGVRLLGRSDDADPDRRPPPADCVVSGMWSTAEA